MKYHAIRTSNDVSVMICPSNNYLLPVQQFCMDQELNIMICAQNISSINLQRIYG